MNRDEEGRNITNQGRTGSESFNRDSGDRDPLDTRRESGLDSSRGSGRGSSDEDETE